MTQITKNFTVEEMTCKCGCGSVPMLYKFMDMLQRVRDLYGKPMKVNSGARCAKYNKAVGGVKDSYHVLGMAADIAVSDLQDRASLARIALMYGLSVIVYPTFLHLDGRSGRPILLVQQTGGGFKAMLGLSEGLGC